MSVAGALIAAVSACSSFQSVSPEPYINPQALDDLNLYQYEIDAVRAMEPHGPEFNQALRVEYLDYADGQYDGYQYADFDHFIRKAVNSAKGEMVLPDTVGSRRIPGDAQGELEAARARLMAALDGNARKNQPMQAAIAQVAFDCWLERTEDRAKQEFIDECKNRFNEAMLAIEGPGIREYIVFFAFDRSDLSPIAVETLDTVVANATAGEEARVFIVGHADRAGPESYNLGLSERRARSVAGYLTANGVDEETIALDWFGETQPLVQTPDGVPEAQNRRVEITLE
ncbi:MAG: OmpA family protein [Geminicoccaceae bacterium]